MYGAPVYRLSNRFLGSAKDWKVTKERTMVDVSVPSSIVSRSVETNAVSHELSMYFIRY
jgi:hypothetical protein